MWVTHSEMFCLLGKSVRHQKQLLSRDAAVAQSGERPILYFPRGQVVLLQNSGDDAWGAGPSVSLLQMDLQRRAAGAPRRQRSGGWAGGCRHRAAGLGQRHLYPWSHWKLFLRFVLNYCTLSWPLQGSGMTGFKVSCRFLARTPATWLSTDISLVLLGIQVRLCQTKAPRGCFAAGLFLTHDNSLHSSASVCRMWALWRPPLCVLLFSSLALHLSNRPCSRFQSRNYYWSWEEIGEAVFFGSPQVKPSFALVRVSMVLLC